MFFAAPDILASTAAQALCDLKATAGTDNEFRLMLLDCHMPETDGFALVEQIRQLEKKVRLAILMLTSADQQGDAARCRALGLNAYLTKPVTRFQLVEAIRVALGEGPQLPSPSHSTRRLPLAPASFHLRILLAEDDLTSQMVARRQIEKLGHSVTIAGNGRQVLSALEQQAFDLILMDNRMPEMDGLQATAAIRATERASGDHTPIIGLTADAMAGDRERCLAAGMDGYVTKPIRVHQVVSEIKRLVTAGTITLTASDPIE